MKDNCSACEQYQLNHVGAYCPDHRDKEPDEPDFEDYEGSQADYMLLEADEKDAYNEAHYEQSREDYQQNDNVY